MGDPDEWDGESDQLDAADTLDTRNVADPLDEGISPPERPWIGDGWGVTAREQAEGDSLDRYLSRELPDVGPGTVTVRPGSLPVLSAEDVLRLGDAGGAGRGTG